jgi:hypothetical protein
LETVMVDKIKAWQCIGCGRIDHPQPCIGICQDRIAEFVRGADYDALAGRASALEALLRRIAFTTPRDGEFEAAWRALQANARTLL